MESEAQIRATLATKMETSGERERWRVGVSVCLCGLRQCATGGRMRWLAVGV